MKQELGLVRAAKKAPTETFHDDGQALGFDILSFWQWSGSDLLSNATRGVLAEYLVARALGAADEPRVEWDAVDVRTPEGVSVEVKASAYIQSWPQERLSRISFATRPTRGWDARSNTACAKYA